MNERRVGAVKPFPWRGKGFGKRLKPSLGQGGLGSCDHHDHWGRFSMIIFLKEILIIIIILHEEPTEIPVITIIFNFHRADARVKLS